MRKTIQPITPADITAACAVIRANRGDYLGADGRPLPLTPAMRHQRILTLGRDALAAVLVRKFQISYYATLNRAIRAGHPGVDVATINAQGAVALGLL